ncbi:type VI secretion system tip protein VgrG [Trinickia caryophylli]|uniref:type VI secretion system Vgr family protein n=1 Tax=Trinickia caryophylli TaxID=28094 RepID=UPI001E64AE8F|nr:type VI secretion system tip protein VgrG [Trinickia caryophylli]WQE12329.1 type VI secretion system tip protein VgrG [Trinickia caryophylli]
MLRLKVADYATSLSVVKSKLTAAFNEPYRLSLVVTSADREIDSAQWVGRRATFTLEEEASVPSVPGLYDPAVIPELIVHGVITRWKRIKVTRDEATYKLRIEPRVALYDRVIDSGVFRDKSVKDLISELFIDRQNIESFDVEFALEDAREKFEQTVIYEESLLHFAGRHCRRAGIFWYFKQATEEDRPKRETIVFGDNPRAYVRSVKVPYEPHSGLSRDWSKAVLSIEAVRDLVPASIQLWDHNYRTPDNSLEVQADVAKEDRSVYGSVNRSIEHHRDADVGQMLVTARRDEQVARQTTFKGTSNIPGLMPGMVVQLTNYELPEAPYGLVVTKVETKAGRVQPAFNRFEATPAHLTWRPEYIPAKHWRWVTGTIPAVVEPYGKSPYAPVDEHGRYPVRPLFLRNGSTRGTDLLALRLMKPSASYQGGFHSPLLPGTEVQLQCEHGDVDRIYIAGALNDFKRPDPVHGLSGWDSRAVWRSPLLGADIRLEDRKGQEGGKFATVYMKSSVSLGYLVDSQKHKRGEGFEVATQGWGTLRASKGLFFSADPFSNPDAPHLEMQAALTQLRAALAEAESMRTVARRATAELADVKAQQAQLEDHFRDLQKAVLLLSAPDGIGAVTPKSIQLSGGEHLTVTAGANADLSVGRNFTVASGEAVSLFANQNGIKALAANGAVDVQAQHGAMNLISHEGMSVASANGRVTITAKDEILLVCGGSYLRITPSGIEDGTRGDRTIYSASYQKLGPQGISAAIPALPSTAGAFDQAFVVRWSGTQIPASNTKYQLLSEGKLIAEGVTTDKGETSLAQSHVPQDAVLKLLDD